MSDPTQLHQVVLNLVTNAFHAVETSGGEIRVKLKETMIRGDAHPGTVLARDRYAQLTVSDTGRGIDPAIADNIFDPYFTTKKQGKGTGLGLAVVHGIVRDHGGDIRLSSQLGRGATFDVYIPVMETAYIRLNRCCIRFDLKR